MASSPSTTDPDVEQGAALRPAFDANGLIAAIVVDAVSGEVLMLAWMNAEALDATRRTGLAHFWSRSRGRLWRKGEESGNELRVTEMRIDCDQDAILIIASVGGNGVACHTGARSCFYRRIDLGAAEPGRELVRITAGKN